MPRPKRRATRRSSQAQPAPQRYTEVDRSLQPRVVVQPIGIGGVHGRTLPDRPACFKWSFLRQCMRNVNAKRLEDVHRSRSEEADQAERDADQAEPGAD